ncbi:hypothetical protein ACOACO_01315 [Nocardioides sp. CPCC 205120]
MFATPDYLVAEARHRAEEVRRFFPRRDTRTDAERRRRRYR